MPSILGMPIFLALKFPNNAKYEEALYMIAL